MKILFYLLIFLFFQNFTYADNSERDPFLPLVSPEGKLINISYKISFSEIKLEAIIYSKDKPLAIINGNLYKEGEKIGEYKIVKINEDKVVLKKGKEEFNLMLYEEKFQNQGR